MRRKRETVLRLEGNDREMLKVVREYRAKYRALSQVLDRHPEVLDAVHEDLKTLSTPNRKGRRGDFRNKN